MTRLLFILCLLIPSLVPSAIATEQMPPSIVVRDDVAAILIGMLAAPGGMEAVRQIDHERD